MPSILNRPPKVDPEKVYIVIEGFASNEGRFQSDQRVSGSNPAVKAHPELFIADGATNAELQQVRSARLALALAGVILPGPGIGMSSGQSINAGRPLRVDELVVCITGVPMTSSGQALRMPVEVGTVLPATDPVVRRLPKHFRPAAADDLPPAAA